MPRRRPPVPLEHHDHDHEAINIARREALDHLYAFRLAAASEYAPGEYAIDGHALGPEGCEP
jgi:hypothetical protein